VEKQSEAYQVSADIARESFQAAFIMSADAHFSAKTPDPAVALIEEGTSVWT